MTVIGAGLGGLNAPLPLLEPVLRLAGEPALIVFDTEVRALTWDEAASEWEVEVDGSEGRHIEIR